MKTLAKGLNYIYHGLDRVEMRITSHPFRFHSAHASIIVVLSCNLICSVCLAERDAILEEKQVSSVPSGLASSPSTGVMVNFPSAPVRVILPLYSELTGRNVIVDAAIPPEPMRLVSQRSLDVKEATAFIESSLLLNGLVFVPVDSKTVKLVSAANGKSPRSESLPVITHVNELPSGEAVVNFILSLENLTPDEAVRTVSQVVELHSYGALTPVPNASAVIVTENSSTIRSISELLRAIDVPPAEIKNELLSLKRSDAEGIATIIKQVYENKPTSGSGGSVRGRSAVPPPQGALAPGMQHPAAGDPFPASESSPAIKVIPYRRTNQVLIVARPVDIAYVKALIQQLDSESEGQTFLKRKLHYISVTDFLPVAYNALARDTDIRTPATDGGQGTSLQSSLQNARSGVGGDDMRGSESLRSAGVSGAIGAGSQGATANASTMPRSGLAQPPSFAPPQSAVIGRTLLIADPQSNSVIVSGSAEHVRTVEQLLLEMDLRPQQIYISTVIGQLSLGDEFRQGYDFLKLLDDFTLQQSVPTVSTPAGSSSGSNTSTLQSSNSGSLISTQPSINGAGTGLSGSGASTASTSTSGGGNTLQSLDNVTNITKNPPGILTLPFTGNGLTASNFGFYGQLGSLSKYVRLFSGNRNFKVLSRPSVFTVNNGKAVISSGQRIAVPVQTLSSQGAAVGQVGTASVASSIEYRDVVLKLEVVPLINSDDEVTLRIAQLNDNIVGSQNISGNSIPTIGTQELSTTVTVRNGHTVVLGGLITESTTNEHNGVPVLKSIPVIGNLFGVREKKKVREELMIFIQPLIVGDSSADQPNSHEAGRTNIMQETLHFAADRSIQSPAYKQPSVNVHEHRTPDGEPYRRAIPVR